MDYSLFSETIFDISLFSPTFFAASNLQYSYLICSNDFSLNPLHKISSWTMRRIFNMAQESLGKHRTGINTFDKRFVLHSLPSSLLRLEATNPTRFYQHFLSSECGLLTLASHESHAATPADG